MQWIVQGKSERSMDSQMISAWIRPAEIVSFFIRWLTVSSSEISDSHKIKDFGSLLIIPPPLQVEVKTL